MADVLNTVRSWMVQATQLKETPAVNIRRTGFQFGMQCEEMSEKMASVFGKTHPMVLALKQMGIEMKAGEHDLAIQDGLFANPKAFLDGDIDLLWVTAGSVAAQGADGEKAFGKVERANFAKFPNGVVTLDKDGKVVKPADWVEPDLLDCVHPSLLPKSIPPQPDEVGTSDTPVTG